MQGNFFRFTKVFVFFALGFFHFVCKFAAWRKKAEW